MTRQRPLGLGTHIFVSDADAAVAFYSEAFGAAELIRHRLPDGRVLFVGQITVEPHRNGVDRFFRQFDELLAPERREIDHLGIGRRCRQQGGGNENGACDFTGHSFLARMGTATPRGFINAGVAVQKSASCPRQVRNADF